MALAHLTINLDAFTGDDHPPVPSYSTITLDPGADHIDAASDVIHVRTIVVSLDRQGKAATANGVPCVDGKVPVVAGVAYAVSAPNVLRGGPYYIPALTAGQVVDLSDYITPGAPLTPDQAATLTARIVALEAAPPGAGVTDHGALTGLGDDDHALYALTDGTRGSFAAPLGADDNYVTDAEKAALHAHSNKAALDLVSGTNTGDQVLPTWSTISGKPAVVAEGATQAAARTAIGAGTSSFSGAYADLSGKPTTMTPTTHAATHAAAGSDPVTLSSAQISDLTETVQDIVGAFIVAGTNVTVTYNDTANTFTVNATASGGTTDPEVVRDVIGAAMVAGSGIQITVNDAGDTITVASTAVLPTRQIIAGTGLSGGGDLSADRTLSVAYGTTAGTAAQGNDSRLSNARTPTAHAASHASGGSDALAVTGLGVGSLADGQMLVRSGSALVGQAVPSGGAAPWMPAPASVFTPAIGCGVGPETIIGPVGGNPGTYTSMIMPTWQAPASYRISAARVVVTTANTTGAATLRIALVEIGADDQPYSLVADLGTVSVATTGDKDITGLTAPVTQGRWYAWVLTWYGTGNLGLRAWPVPYGHMGQSSAVPNRANIYRYTATHGASGPSTPFTATPPPWTNLFGAPTNNVAGPLETVFVTRSQLS